MADRALVERIAQFNEAVQALPWVAEKLASGQQFNAYESASYCEDDEDEDREYSVCIGPITDARFICGIEGAARARLLEAALKVATLAAVAHPPTSDARTDMVAAS